MRVVITGAGGQLGKELIRQFREDNYEVFPYTKEQLDITQPNKIKETFNQIRPHVLINAAAFTKVDLCETEIEKAYLVNTIAAYYLACEAKKYNVKLFHISTDYVFDGKKSEPYTEDDITNPYTIYGKSKEIGEKLMLDVYDNVTIIRTSWLYGHKGNNFINTIKRIAGDSKEIKVVNDQYGSPTYTKDVALALKQLLNKASGVYHITNSGSCSWFEFAREILLSLNMQTIVRPISTEEYGVKTPRPNYSVLGHKKINSIGIYLRPWKDGLYEYLKTEANCDDN